MPSGYCPCIFPYLECSLLTPFLPLTSVPTSQVPALQSSISSMKPFLLCLPDGTDLLSPMFPHCNLWCKNTPNISLQFSAYLPLD